MTEVVLLKRNEWRRSLESFLVRGAVEAKEWSDKLRPPEAGWCEIGIWDQQSVVSSFGGSVWPGAWPSLFRFEGPAGRKHAVLTELGAAVFAAARVAGIQVTA